MKYGRLLTFRGLLITAIAVAVWCVPAFAHKPSDSYLTLNIGDDRIRGQWDVALRDLEYAIGLDGNGDGKITWGELRARHAAIAAYVLPRLDVAADTGTCAKTVRDQLVDNHTDGAYTVLRFDVNCPGNPLTLTLTYDLFANLDPQHRGILRLNYKGGARTAIFGPADSTQRFELGRASSWTQFLSFVYEGVWHIWIGFDHILFLIVLLLPAVLYREGTQWRAQPAFGPAFWNVLKIVTAFTVAHSITLSLAALGIVNLPSRFVESAIAASIVVGALNNIYPVVRQRLWLVAFSFGLLHGFGFASVLADLGLPRGALVLALVGFNIGVEIGQLAIVAAFVPVAFMLRRAWAYPRVVLTGGSLVIAIVAAIWMAERMFNFKLLPV
ncbi:MAG: HupE/UreJ family protein [Gammaproteobacteria bacterium]